MGLSVIHAGVIRASDVEGAFLDGEGVGAGRIVVVVACGNGVADGVGTDIGEAGNSVVLHFVAGVGNGCTFWERYSGRCMSFAVIGGIRICGDGIAGERGLGDVDGVGTGCSGIAGLRDLPVDRVGTDINEGGVGGAPLIIFAGGAVLDRRALGLGDGHGDAVGLAVIAAVIAGAAGFDGAVLDGEGVGAGRIVVVVACGDGVADLVGADFREGRNLVVGLAAVGVGDSHALGDVCGCRGMGIAVVVDIGVGSDGIAVGVNISLVDDEGVAAGLDLVAAAHSRPVNHVCASVGEAGDLTVTNLGRVPHIADDSTAGDQLVDGGGNVRLTVIGHALVGSDLDVHVRFVDLNGSAVLDINIVAACGDLEPDCCVGVGLGIHGSSVCVCAVFFVAVGDNGIGGLGDGDSNRMICAVIRSVEASRRVLDRGGIDGQGVAAGLGGVAGGRDLVVEGVSTDVGLAGNSGQIVSTFSFAVGDGRALDGAGNIVERMCIAVVGDGLVFNRYVQIGLQGDGDVDLAVVGAGGRNVSRSAAVPCLFTVGIAQREGAGDFFCLGKRGEDEGAEGGTLVCRNIVISIAVGGFAPAGAGVGGLDGKLTAVVGQLGCCADEIAAFDLDGDGDVLACGDGGLVSSDVHGEAGGLLDGDDWDGGAVFIRGGHNGVQISAAHFAVGGVQEIHSSFAADADLGQTYSANRRHVVRDLDQQVTELAVLRDAEAAVHNVGRSQIAAVLVADFIAEAAHQIGPFRAFERQVFAQHDGRVKAAASLAVLDALNINWDLYGFARLTGGCADLQMCVIRHTCRKGCDA